jgi:HAE1 family hydrophobic/amphiphilic exporter-1
MTRRWAFKGRRRLVAGGLSVVIACWGGETLAEQPARAASGSLALPGEGLTMRYELLFFQQETRASAPEPETTETLPLTLQDAAHLALLNNREIKIERLTSRVREEEIRRERAAFHPLLTLDSSTDHSEKAAGTVLAGTTTPEIENVEWNSGMKTKLVTGAVASLDFRNKRTESNSAFQTLSPQYASDLVFTLTQPLLRDFGPKVNRTRIKVAENNLGISRHQLKATVASVLAEVENTYWDLVLATRDLRRSHRSLEQTQRLAQRTRELVAEGRLPEIALLQGRAAVLEKEGDVLVAQNTLKDSLSRLQDVLNLDRTRALTLVPLDEPTSEIKELDVEQALKAALANRPEPQQARLDLENRHLALRYAKNQLRPQLNLFGSIGLSGLAGTSTIQDPLAETTLGPLVVPPSSEGGYGTSLENLFSGDFPTWKAGLVMTIPLGNVAARSELRKTELELEKARLAIESVQRRIALEVEKVARQVKAAVKMIEGARALREQAERRSEMAQEQLELGLAPMTAVTEAQRELTLAERGELKALIDYNKLLALFDKVTGTTPEKFQVEF